MTDAALAEAVARRLGEGATVTTIERITSLVLANPQVMAVASKDCRRWSTRRELRSVEERFVDVVTTAHTGTQIDHAAVTAAVEGRPSLGVDQAAAVARLGAATAPLSVLIGPDGTGRRRYDSHDTSAVRLPVCTDRSTAHERPSLSDMTRRASACGP